MTRSNPRLRSLLALWLGARLVFELGCSPGEGSRFQFGNADNGRTVVVRVGDALDIALDTVGPVYYATPLLSSSAVRFLGESRQRPNPPPPGGFIRQTFRFEAVHTGRATITIAREMSGFPGTSFSMRVDVY
jgi:hypothetical protein